MANLTRAAGSVAVAYDDVAAFMVEQVEQTGYLRQAPIVSGA